MTYGWKLFPTLTREQAKELLEDLADKMDCEQYEHSDQAEQGEAYFEIAGI